jgi:AcrR family transcriptional regulator
MHKQIRRSTAEGTRRAIVDAALETLKAEGFSGATSRAIARKGGFNQALVFYHFGTLDGLLLAALDRTSEERFAVYERAIAGAQSIEELADVAARIYNEDRRAGHITVVSQMIAGSVSRPDLAREMVARMEPWIDLCETAIGKVLDWLHVPELVPRRELAYAFATFYLGVNLLTHLDEGGTRTDALFRRAQALAPVLEAMAATRS